MNTDKHRWGKRIFACILALLLCTPFPVHAGETEHAKPNAKNWKSNRDAGRDALKQNNLFKAEVFFQAALAEAENFGPKDRRVAESLRDLGNLLFVRGSFAEAEPLLRRAADMHRGDHDYYAEADSLIMLGQACQKLGKADDAESCYQRAEKIFEKNLQPHHALAVICEYYRAALYDEQHKNSQAESLLKDALYYFQNPSSAWVTAPGDPYTGQVQTYYYGSSPNDCCTLLALNRLSLLCARQGRSKEADSFFKQLLSLLGKQDELGAPLFQQALKDMADLQLAQTNYPSTEAILKVAIAREQKSPGPNDRATLHAQTFLAFVYGREYKNKDAEALYRKTLAVEDRVFGPDSVESCETLTGLSRFLAANLQYTDAEPLYRRLADRTLKLAPDSRFMGAVLAEQGALYSKLGRNKELEAVYRQQVALGEKWFGPDDKALLRPLEDYALLLWKEQRAEEAEQLELRIGAIRTSIK